MKKCNFTTNIRKWSTVPASLTDVKEYVIGYFLAWPPLHLVVRGSNIRGLRLMANYIEQQKDHPVFPVSGHQAEEQKVHQDSPC